MISIINISQLQDNYSYAILNNKEVIIIDPADSISILRYIGNNQLSLKAILLTHHHTDHTAGVEGILNKIKVPVYSPNKKVQNKKQMFLPIQKRKIKKDDKKTEKKQNKKNKLTINN